MEARGLGGAANIARARGDGADPAVARDGHDNRGGVAVVARGLGIDTVNARSRGDSTARALSQDQ